MGNWSSDGSSSVGWQHGPAGENQIVVCQVAEGSRRRLTRGTAPRWSPGDGRIYFVRVAAEGTSDLWTIAADGTDERRLFNLGAFRAIDAFFDVSKRNEVVWAPYKAGDRQVWSAAVR